MLRLREAFSALPTTTRGSMGGKRHRNVTDSWQERRRRDAFRFTLAGLAVVVTPITAHNFYIAQWIPAFAGLFLLFLISANIWLLSTQREAYMSPQGVVFLTLCLVLISVVFGEGYSLFWLYPLLTILPILLRRKLAFTLVVLCGLVVVPLVFMRFTPETALIICLSLLHTWLISAWLMFAVNEQSRRLEEAAVTDPLTTAHNRRYFDLQAEQALEQWKRYHKNAALLMLDIDHFKRVNDEHGHAMGDHAIVTLVQLVQKRKRAVDTLCRFGGEEFVLVLPETSVEQATVLAEDLREQIRAGDILPDRPLTVSIGVADLAGIETVDEWLKVADDALYVAKRNGRDRTEQAGARLPELEDLPDNVVPAWR